MLDLINPDPAPSDRPSEVAPGASVVEPSGSPSTIGTVEWTEGRRIRSWATVVSSSRTLQVNDCEVTYEILEPDGTSRRLSETFPMRFVFRYELEHLLARCGFGIVALYGDYDRSAFTDESLGMIAIASSNQAI